MSLGAPVLCYSSAPMRIVQLVRRPLDDYLAALEASLAGPDRRCLWLALLGAVLSWWIYVPIHELLHAYGCIWAGGSVSRLEIDAIYGAAWLQQLFPFVTSGSDYAGQLTGFDTRGSDLIYLATDALPFVLTILIGVPLLRSAQSASPSQAAWRLGVAVPIAYAPFLSITGDYFEMGSILVSRLATWWQPIVDVSRWRSDDLFKRAGELFGSSDWSALDVAVITASALLGAVLAFLTYGLGTMLAARGPQRPLQH